MPTARIQVCGGPSNVEGRLGAFPADILAFHSHCQGVFAAQGALPLPYKTNLLGRASLNIGQGLRVPVRRDGRKALVEDFVQSVDPQRKGARRRAHPIRTQVHRRDACIVALQWCAVVPLFAKRTRPEKEPSLFPQLSRELQGARQVAGPGGCVHGSALILWHLDVSGSAQRLPRCRDSPLSGHESDIQ